MAINELSGVLDQGCGDLAYIRAPYTAINFVLEDTAVAIIQRGSCER